MQTTQPIPQTSPRRVQVVGGACYSGSHMVKHLLRTGCEVATHDNFSTGYRNAVQDDEFVLCGLAEVNWLALQELLNVPDSAFYNLGNGNGFSVQEVIDTARKVTSREITLKDSPGREEGLARLVADCLAARKVLDWQPAWDDLSIIVIDARKREGKAASQP